MEQRPPARTPPKPGSFDTRPAQVAAWIAGLPLVNLGESSRRVFNALAETNGLDVPADQRFQFLEALRAPVGTLCEAMKTHFVGKSFPLSSKAQQTARLSQALATQMAIGYRIVVDDGSGRTGLLQGHRLDAVACHRALAYLGQSLLHTYQAYGCCPRGIWEQVHALFRPAEAAGFARAEVKPADADDPDSSTVETVYKRILLLALACPYRLRQGEVELVYAWLRSWAPHAILKPFADDADSDALFFANLASDDPPTYRVLRSSQHHPGDCRLLNTEKLSAVIREARYQWHTESLQVQKINERVVRRLMLAWGVMPKRRFSRTQKHSTTLVAVGLSAIHYFVSGEAAFEAGSDGAAASQPGFGGPARFEANDPQEQVNRRLDPWAESGAERVRDTFARHPRDGYIDFGAGPDTLVTPGKTPGPRYQTRTWKMINVSAGGYRLLWDSDEATRAQVGELLGLRENGDPDSFHMMLGVVRWMKQGAEAGLELGVEMLSPGAVAIGTKPVKANDGEYQRSLLLPAVHAIGLPATLLMPALSYRIGDRVKVAGNGRESQVTLTKLVENTGTFAQYQFEAIDSAADGAASTTTVGISEDFESLWPVL